MSEKELLRVKSISNTKFIELRRTATFLAFEVSKSVQVSGLRVLEIRVELSTFKPIKPFEVRASLERSTLKICTLTIGKIFNKNVDKDFPAVCY